MLRSNKAPATPRPQALGEKQTIPARHGIAAFVPKGHTIKIINTYGRQVVDTWAFALGAPPEDDDDIDDIDDEQWAESKDEGELTRDAAKPEHNCMAVDVKSDGLEGRDANKTAEEVTTKAGDGQKRTWGSYILSVRRGVPKQPAQKESEKEVDEGEDKDDGERKDKVEADKLVTDATKHPQKTPDGTAKKSGLSSYVASSPSLPSVRSRRQKTPREQKTWASYFPSGKGFSAYSTAKSSISAFMAQHQRDPTKSIAEQLYDFSKTPVGAASLSGIASAATGSGYAGSLYAAYRAYDRADPASAAPPMEYMSMQHSHTSTLHLSPRVGDTMVSNLRAPVMTLVEDTSASIHDTLIAACDPQRYKELDVDKWEEHGSCAENLVFALKEINGKSGLKGHKAVGRDVTINMVPAPMNLFMNIPWTHEGDISFEAPKSKRGGHVKFRAERDIVVVMSACPQDVLPINDGKPMVAHFVVESGSEADRKAAEEKDKEAQEIIEKAKLRTQGKLPPKRKSTTDGASNAAAQAPMTEIPKKVPEADGRTSTEADGRTSTEHPEADDRKNTEKSTPATAAAKTERFKETPSTSSVRATNHAEQSTRDLPEPGKKKPKKLERRGTLTTTSRVKE